MYCIFWKLELQITVSAFGLFTQPVLYIHQGDQKTKFGSKLFLFTLKLVFGRFKHNDDIFLLSKISIASWLVHW